MVGPRPGHFAVQGQNQFTMTKHTTRGCWTSSPENNISNTCSLCVCHHSLQNTFCKRTLTAPLNEDTCTWPGGQLIPPVGPTTTTTTNGTEGTCYSFSANRYPYPNMLAKLKQYSLFLSPSSVQWYSILDLWNYIPVYGFVTLEPKTHTCRLVVEKGGRRSCWLVNRLLIL